MIMMTMINYENDVDDNDNGDNDKQSGVLVYTVQ